MEAIEALRNLFYVGRIGFIFPQFVGDDGILEEREGDGLEVHVGPIFFMIGVKKRKR